MCFPILNAQVAAFICPFRALLTSAYTVYLPTTGTVLIRTNIRRASATCFSTCVPSLGKKQRQFLKPKRFYEAVIYSFLGLQQLRR